MKKFSSEFGQNYETYTFGYANYALMEDTDSLGEIYAQGYLPYSGAKNVQGYFYLARSARVPLLEWKMSSENRRIAKKFDGIFEKKITPFSEFKATEEFFNFCVKYFTKRHGKHTMPRERLKLLLSFGIISNIISYSKDGHIVGYVCEGEQGDMGHYWYSFYNLSFVHQSLGMWLMLDAVRDAKARGLTHYYIGTVYGEKALYKLNFEPLEWWDGREWSTDVKLLKKRARSDHERIISGVDTWKGEHKPFE